MVTSTHPTFYLSCPFSYGKQRAIVLFTVLPLEFVWGCLFPWIFCKVGIQSKNLIRFQFICLLFFLKVGNYKKSHTFTSRITFCSFLPPLFPCLPSLLHTQENSNSTERDKIWKLHFTVPWSQPLRMFPFPYRSIVYLPACFVCKRLICFFLITLKVTLMTTLWTKMIPTAF